MASLQKGKQKVRRIRFSYDDDVIFLREVVAQNPLENTDKWETVKINLEQITGKTFLIRTLKQHLQLLLEAFMKKDELSKIRSGNEEPYSEKDHLLQEITIICIDTDRQLLSKKKNKVVHKEKIIAQIGKEAREKFALDDWKGEENEELLDLDNVEFTIENEVIVSDHDYIPPVNNEEAGPSVRVIDTEGNNKQTKRETPQKENILTPSRKRNKNKSKTLRKDALLYLSEKEGKEHTTKKKELELKEKKLEIEERRLLIAEMKVRLEEEKFELEKRERLEKMEIEKERFHLEVAERRNSVSLVESQQKLIEHLLNKLSNAQ